MTNKQNIRKSYLVGILAFVLVLLFMPLGHALMVLNEITLGQQKLIGAFGIGLIGTVLLVLGLVNKKKLPATLLGLLAGVLIWTGWVEFSFVWIAEKLSVAPQIEDGEVTTKPEYLVMLSSLGLLLTLSLFFLFSKTNCQFFNWFQAKLKLKTAVRNHSNHIKPKALVTFIETIMILWTFYIVLLVVYDPEIAGDRHPATYIVLLGSLGWSAYLIINLLRIKKMDYAIRYAIPTVIIFWNVVEIFGRWDFFEEIWIKPLLYWKEVGLISIVLVASIIIAFIRNKEAGGVAKKQLF